MVIPVAVSIQMPTALGTAWVPTKLTPYFKPVRHRIHFGGQGTPTADN